MFSFKVDQSILDSVNSRLQQKCPGMFIGIICSKRTPDCYLRLVYQDVILSQIQLDFIYLHDHGVLQMLSDTFETHFRKRKFNMLLRCVLLLLLPSMEYDNRPVLTLESHAQNPISAYALLRLGFSLSQGTNSKVRQKITAFSPVIPPIDQEKKQIVQTTPGQKQKRQQNEKGLRQYLNMILDAEEQQEQYKTNKQTLSRQQKHVSQIVLVLQKEDFEKAAILARHRLTSVFQQLKCIDFI